MSQFDPLAHHIEFFFESRAWGTDFNADDNLIPVGIILDLSPAELEMLLKDLR